MFRIAIHSAVITFNGAAATITIISSGTIINLSCVQTCETIGTVIKWQFSSVHKVTSKVTSLNQSLSGSIRSQNNSDRITLIYLQSSKNLSILSISRCKNLSILSISRCKNLSILKCFNRFSKWHSNRHFRALKHTGRLQRVDFHVLTGFCISRTGERLRVSSIDFYGIACLLAITTIQLCSIVISHQHSGQIQHAGTWGKPHTNKRRGWITVFHIDSGAVARVLCMALHPWWQS